MLTRWHESIGAGTITRMSSDVSVADVRSMERVWVCRDSRRQAERGREGDHRGRSQWTTQCSSFPGIIPVLTLFLITFQWYWEVVWQSGMATFLIKISC